MGGQAVNWRKLVEDALVALIIVCGVYALTVAVLSLRLAQQ